MTHEEVAHAIESILAGAGTGLEVEEPRTMNGLVCIPISINGERFFLTVDSADDPAFEKPDTVFDAPGRLNRPSVAWTEICPGDKDPCYVGGDEAHWRCGTVQCAKGRRR